MLSEFLEVENFKNLMILRILNQMGCGESFEGVAVGADMVRIIEELLKFEFKNKLEFDCKKW